MCSRCALVFAEPSDLKPDHNNHATSGSNDKSCDYNNPTKGVPKILVSGSCKTPAPDTPAMSPPQRKSVAAAAAAPPTTTQFGIYFRGLQSCLSSRAGHH